MQKRLHKHGGSKAVDLPASFIKKLSSDVVNIEIKGESLIIRGETELDRLESDANFKFFIDCLMQDALKNPQRLKDIREIWDEEWEDLLKGVSTDDEF